MNVSFCNIKDVNNINKIFALALPDVEAPVRKTALTTYKGILVCRSPEVTGFALLYPRSDVPPFRETLWLDYFGVLPSRRGQGDAATLCGAWEALASEAGFDSVSLAVFSDNERGIRFYQKTGYLKLRDETDPMGRLKYIYSKTLPSTSDHDPTLREKFGTRSRKHPIEAVSALVRTLILRLSV